MKNLIIKLLSYFGLTLLSSLKQMSEGASHVQGLQSEKINELIARIKNLSRIINLDKEIQAKFQKSIDAMRDGLCHQANEVERLAEDRDFLVNYLEIIFQAQGRCFNGQYFAYTYKNKDQTNLLRILDQVRAERCEAQEALNAEQSIPMQINQTQD